MSLTCVVQIKGFHQILFNFLYYPACTDLIEESCALCHENKQ